MFDKLTTTFSSIANLFKRQKIISEVSLEETSIKIQNALIDADVPLEVTRAFIEMMKQNLVGKKIQIENS